LRVNGGVTPSGSKKLGASNVLSRRNSKIVPWIAFVPDLVTALMTPPGGASELGGVVVRLDAELFDRVDAEQHAPMLDGALSEMSEMFVPSSR